MAGLAGVDVNLQDEHGNTALRLAARRGAWRRVKVLLAVPRIDVNLPSKDGCTPLHGAVAFGHPKCVELLLHATGIKINKVDNEGYTSLANAANLGELECLKLLLQADGIAVNKTDKDGWSPLIIAANLGCFECIKALLEDKRVNVNQPDNEGHFPLWHTCVHPTGAMSNMGACDGRSDDHTDPIRGLVLLLRSRRVNTTALDHAIGMCKLHHPSEREISLAEAGGKPLDDWHLMAQHVLPILQAEAKGEKRWCTRRKARKTKPNETCPCGDGKKYKKCCGANYTGLKGQEGAAADQGSTGEDEQDGGGDRRMHGAEKDHPDIATSLDNLAALYHSQGRYGEAEPLHVEVLEMRRRVHGAEKDHPDIATSLNNLAAMYDSQGRYGEAEPLYVAALEMRRRVHGAEKDHPDIAGSLNNLATLYCETGRFQEAEEMYEEVERMFLCSFGEDHPTVQFARGSLAVCRNNMASPQGIEMMERAERKKKLQEKLAQRKEAAAAATTPMLQRSKSEEDRASYVGARSAELGGGASKESDIDGDSPHATTTSGDVDSSSSPTSNPLQQAAMQAAMQATQQAPVCGGGGGGAGLTLGEYSEPDTVADLTPPYHPELDALLRAGVEFAPCVDYTQAKKGYQYHEGTQELGDYLQPDI
jgi:tetratricopeptide (TPR) repeat protein